MPQRVLDEFSKRTEQVEQKAKELGITTAKGKDGLAALTRERKQKQFTKPKLRELWNARVSAEERASILNNLRNEVSNAPTVSEMKAIDFAMQHCYERASIVTDKELLRHALRFGMGDVDLEKIKRQLLRDELIKETVDGRQWLTTKDVLAEEKRLIDFVADGKGKFKPFGSGKYQFQNQKLSDEQRNAVRHVLQSTERVASSAGVRSDQTIWLRNLSSIEHYPDKLRRIHFVDEETGKSFFFLTNNFALPALTIALLYKSRWKVELFFKWIKQHLRIKHFYGASDNAVKTQIWISICVYVLVALVKKQLESQRSLYSILQILSVNAFEQTPLHQLLMKSASQDLEDRSCNQLIFSY